MQFPQPDAEHMTPLFPRSCRVNQRRTRGFSLIEVLVAATLVALMGALLVSTLSSSLTIKNEVEQHSERYHVIRQALARVTRDISMAFLSDQFIPGTPPPTNFKGGMHDLEFSAFGHVVRKKNAQESDQQTIKFSIGKDDRLGVTSLIRSYEVNINVKNSREIRQTMCRDIKNIRFSYFDEKKGKFVDEWNTESVTTQRVLPSRVRIQLTAIMDEDTTEDFFSEARVYITAPIRLMR